MSRRTQCVSPAAVPVRFRALGVALALPLLAAAAPVRATPPAYPDTPRGTQVDRYFGEEVGDPYRWLESLESPAVHDWVRAQNAASQPFLEAIPSRARIKARLGELWNYERWGASLQGAGSFVVPERRGGRYFYLKTEGLADQPVLYVTERLGGSARVLLDSNRFSADRTVALSSYELDPDGRHVAYSTSDGGTDWRTWRIRDVSTGVDLAESLGLTKFTSVAWAADGRGFWYSRYPARGDGEGDDGKQVSIWFHRLGTPQSADTAVYAIDDHPTRNPYPRATDDGRFLLIQVSDGYQANAWYYAELAPGAAPGGAVRPVRLLDRWDGIYEFLGNAGRTFWFRTNHDAPNGRIVAIDLDRPEPAHWRTLVPEGKDAIEFARAVGDRFVVGYLHDARAVVRSYATDGRGATELALPGLGQVQGFDGRQHENEVFYAYTDFLTPWTIYRYDVRANRSELVHRPSVALDPARYVTEQVFVRSKDGTRVPMFLTRRRDARPDGSQPTLLYGYGGFDLSVLPTFSVPVATWLEMGGVYAVANLRGGGEYGRAWHEAGTKARKQNVFDDFAASAEWLIANRWTNPARLAISGRSNGGLLVGATLTQRPELFAAALPAVGVLDMLRYHTASMNARQWSSDYGLSEDEAEYRALRRYSPVHNVRPGVCYPATLVTTAERDDRVVPWHSFKFAAALQAAQRDVPGCTRPVLLRVETRAGHGAGKPTWMQIEDYADQWAFLTRALGMDDPAGHGP
jgi:prolyl oligopeptidase